MLMATTQAQHHLLVKAFVGDIVCTQCHSALVGICNAEHDSQLQFPHQVIATMPLEDVLARLDKCCLDAFVLVLPRLVLLDGLPAL